MATLERQQSSKGKKQKQRKQRGKGDGGGGGGGGVGNGVGEGGLAGVWAGWDGTSGESCGGGDAGGVTHQLETLRRRLSALDCELRESKQDTERTLQDLQQRKEQELHLIKDLGEGGKEKGAGRKGRKEGRKG